MMGDIEMQNVRVKKLREETDVVEDPWPEFRRRLCEVMRFVLIVIFIITGIAGLIVITFPLGYFLCNGVYGGSCTNVFSEQTFFLGTAGIAFLALTGFLLTLLIWCIGVTWEYIMEPFRRN